jgi:hypothetical protein
LRTIKEILKYNKAEGLYAYTGYLNCDHTGQYAFDFHVHVYDCH